MGLSRLDFFFDFGDCLFILFNLSHQCLSLGSIGLNVVQYILLPLFLVLLHLCNQLVHLFLLLIHVGSCIEQRAEQLLHIVGLLLLEQPGILQIFVLVLNFFHFLLLVNLFFVNFFHACLVLAHDFCERGDVLLEQHV